MSEPSDRPESPVLSALSAPATRPAAPQTQPVVIAPYDARWAQQFVEAQTALLGVFRTDATRIDHIGSTAVPGLAAKPIIDIGVGVRDYPLSPETARALEALGYEDHGENGLPGRHFFVRPGQPLQHLHVFKDDNPEWTRHLLLRDYLRVNASARERYQTLKKRLAGRYRNDRGAYTDGKTELIRDLEAEARDWRRRTPWYVRPATVSDAYAIARVHVSSWRDSCRNILPEQVRFLVDQSVERCFEMHAKGIAEHDISGVVAEADGRVVGFAVAGPSDRETFASELFALYVLPEVQGRGVGRALVGRLAASLQAGGHDSLLAWVLVDNPATRFYERLGARACATDTLTLGGEALEEVGFGWRDLTALSRLGAASAA